MMISTTPQAKISAQWHAFGIWIAGNTSSLTTFDSKQTNTLLKITLSIVANESTGVDARLRLFSKA